VTGPGPVRRPVLYLDVDGVVNLGWFTDPERFGELRAAGWHAGRVTGDPAGLQEGFRVVLNPGWGLALRGLADLGAELVWASGWNEGANLHVGPLLGLPRLPVAPAGHGAKASTVIPWGGLRPWAWLEDSEAGLEAAVALTPPGVPCLPVLVDRATGLTWEHLDRVASWLGSL
jgi:hypothetical protein